MFRVAQPIVGVLALVAALSASAAQSQAAEGLLGVRIQQFGYGVYVQGVLPGTSAQAIGIQPGWQMVGVNNQPINSISDALFAKQFAPENTPIPFLFRRPGGSYVSLYGTFSNGVVLYSMSP